MLTQIAILGSTGSIGTQTLDIVRAHPDRYAAFAISAHRSVDKLVEQAIAFHPQVVCIADSSCYTALNDKLHQAHRAGTLPCLPTVMAGDDALIDMVTMPEVHVVVAAMVGFAGLRPTIRAIEAGKTIALANKETLVVAGDIICRLVQEHRVPLLPVDSEHSAIFQCLQGERKQDIERILLTASGGPFRHHTSEQMERVTAAEALQHPNWKMGAKITIDSASMMNKGFEVIEAKWLFDVPYHRIQVLVHPQSIVHSAVEYRDGAVKAQLGTPDMRLPIQYALSYPERLPLQLPKLNLFEVGQLTFEQPDVKRFPCLQLAYEAIARSGNMPCALNAANEVVNLAFRENRCGFLQMADIIAYTLSHTDYIAQPTLDDYIQTDLQARRVAQQQLKI